jgi:hypothetical protein
VVVNRTGLAHGSAWAVATTVVIVVVARESQEVSGIQENETLLVVAVETMEVVSCVTVMPIVLVEVSIESSAVIAAAVCRVTTVFVSNLTSVVSLYCVTEIVEVGLVIVVHVVVG